MKIARWQWGLILALFVPCLWIGVLYNVDLIVLFDTMHLLAKGEWHLIYSGWGENGSIGRYFYGPFSLLVFAPFGFLSYAWVKGIWLFLQSVSYFLFWGLLARLLPSRHSISAWLWLLIWAFAINPLHNNFQSNNIQLFLAVMLLGAEALTRFDKRGYDWLAAFLITTAGAIKIFPFFLFGFYWLARPKLRVPLLGCLTFTLIAPFLAFGPSRAALLYRSFAHNVTSYGQDNSFIKVDDICCLPSLVARWLYSFGISEAQSAPYVKGLIVGMAGAFLFYVWWKRREMANTGLYATLWTLALSLMAFLNPSTRPHYYIFYIPALWHLINLWAEQKLAFWQKSGVVAAVLLVAATQEGITGKALNNLLEAWSIPTYGMLILCLLTLWQVKNVREQKA